MLIQALTDVGYHEISLIVMFDHFVSIARTIKLKKIELGFRYLNLYFMLISPS